MRSTDLPNPHDQADRVEAVVIGAGVVGLAVARSLAQRGLEVIILEAENAIGSQTSSRHSEVIHAGIYYPADSLKAKFCVRGRHLLYDFCASHGVDHQRCGKLIVATDQLQLDTLMALQQKGLSNGVSELQMLSSAQVNKMEPELQCSAALLSASTGIIDSHALMLALLGDAEQQGASLALLSQVVAIEPSGDGCLLQVRVGGREADDAQTEELFLHADLVVNCTGHQAPGLAATALEQTGEMPAAAPLAKGNYFRLAARSPCSHLIYPVPEPGGLGVHLTLDLAGQSRFGPDVEWVDQFDYEVRPARAQHFYQAIRRYWPGLPDDALVPDYAGIRPKAIVNGEIADDFIIKCHRGSAGVVLIQLFGIESPGLTSSLAIAEHVAQLP